MSRARAAIAGGDRDVLLGVVIGAIACVLLFSATALFQQDSWLALLAGREIWNSGIPHHDTLTLLTEGRRWVDQQWLSQLGIFALYRVGGLGLVSVVHTALVVASLAGSVAIGRRRGTEFPALLLVLVMGLPLVLIASVVVRTQAYAYPLFVATVYLLSSDSRSPSNRVYWTLPLLVLWSNVHGSAMLGAGMVSLRGLTILYERVRHDARDGHGPLAGAALTIAGPLCLLVTPYGLGAITYYGDTLFNPDFTRLVAEWRPITDVPPAAVSFFAVIGLAVWSLGRHPGRLTLWERILLIVLMVGGILAVRNVVWAQLALLMLPVVSLRAGAEAGVRPRLNQALALVVAATIAVIAVVTLARPDSDFESRYPQGVLRAVDRTTASDPAINVFADVQLADWLLWRLPQLRGRVAFDARLELQPRGGLDPLVRALTATGIDWKRAARGYRLVVLAPDHVKEAARGFRAEPGRRVLFDNPHGLVILRSPGVALGSAGGGRDATS